MDKTERELLELSDLMREAVDRKGGGELVCEKLGMNYNSFKGQLNPHNRSNRFQVELFLKLLKLTVPHNAGAVQYLANLINGIFVPLPDFDPNNFTESLKDLLLKAAEEAGDVARELREASRADSAGGVELAPEEKFRLVSEIKDVLIVFFQMLVALGALAKNPGLWNCEICHMACGTDGK